MFGGDGGYGGAGVTRFGFLMQIGVDFQSCISIKHYYVFLMTMNMIHEYYIITNTIHVHAMQVTDGNENKKPGKYFSKFEWRN